MNGAFHIGAIGLRSQQRALDIVASNIANVNTPAFKRADVRFSDVLATQADPEVPRADLVDAAAASAGVMVDATPAVNAPGAIKKTGNAMDLAIDGQGFIEVMGPGGQTLLSRGGTLKVGDDGLLATAGGWSLKAAVTVPDDATAITIAPDGVVRAVTGASEVPIEIGQIALVKVGDAGALEVLDGGVYRVAEGARLVDAQPGEDGTGALVQGGLEQSNVEMTTEMVEMMLVQRAYAANAQVVQAADQLMAIANGLRR